MGPSRGLWSLWTVVSVCTLSFCYLKLKAGTLGPNLGICILSSSLMIPMQGLGAGFWETQVYSTDKHHGCIRKAMFVWDESPQPISSAEFLQFHSSGLDTSLGCLSTLGSLLPWNAKFSSPFTPQRWPSRTGQTEPRDSKPSLCKKSNSSHYIF